MSTDLTTTIEQTADPQAAVVLQGSFSDASNFELAQRMARALSESTLVPKEFQKSVPNCLIALNMACRMDCEPMMVMQNLYIVYGRPSWSSKFLIALFSKLKQYSGLNYNFFGEEGKDSWGCYCSATRSDGEIIKGSRVTISMAKSEGWYSKNGSKWQTMPEQMLRWRAASFFINVHHPELSLGLATREEIEDSIDGEVISRQGRLVKGTAATA